MVTTPTAQKSEQLWPSLANKKSTPSASFFGDDKKLLEAAGNKGMMTNVTASKELDVSDVESDENECKAPTYKNSLSDALASALKSASLNESAGKKSKKKSKKTLLFSSGI